jgi:hypothetical protein
MSGESPRDGDRADESEPRRLFFDDLPDEPDTTPVAPPTAAAPATPSTPATARPRPVATTPAASARRRRDIEESLVDTGPMEPIREPIPDEQVTGRQLYFDDVDEPAEEPEDEQARRAVPAMLAGGSTLHGRRGRHLPIGAVLAVLGVLVLVAVIASIGGRGGDGKGDTGNHKVLADQTTKVKHTPTHSARSQQPSTPPRHSPSVRPTAPVKPSRSAAGTPVAVLKKLPLTVLNNTTSQGLAQRAATTFSSRGWNVGGIGNYTGIISSTTVYYDATSPTEEQAAAALAEQFSGLMHAEPRFAGLPGAGLTVVLAPNWIA